MRFILEKNGQFTINICDFVGFIKPYVIVCLISFLLGIVSCLLFSKRNHKSMIIIKEIYKSFKENNIENIVFFIAILLVVISIILQCFNVLNGFSNTIINIFGTLIVSWIATKKNSEAEIKKKEEETAKKSRRYLNSIKTMATNAIKIISDSISNNTLNFTSEQIIVLERAKDQVEHIETGIETSIFDWEDMMSPEDIDVAHKIDDAIGTVPDFDKDKFKNEEQINQEDA